jgi:hypothetical protein
MLREQREQGLVGETLPVRRNTWSSSTLAMGVETQPPCSELRTNASVGTGRRRRLNVKDHPRFTARITYFS